MRLDRQGRLDGKSLEACFSGDWSPKVAGVRSDGGSHRARMAPRLTFA